VLDALAGVGPKHGAHQGLAVSVYRSSLFSLEAYVLQQLLAVHADVLDAQRQRSHFCLSC